MSTTQLVGVITLVGTLLVAGIQLGRSQQQLEDLKRRIETLASSQRFLHGNVPTFLPQGPKEPQQ